MDRAVRAADLSSLILALGVFHLDSPYHLTQGDWIITHQAHLTSNCGDIAEVKYASAIH